MAIIENHQHIYGGVREDGSKIFGEGFYCDRVKEGTYIVKFERLFTGLPTPVCTTHGHEWRTFDKSIAIIEAAPHQFICVTSSPDRPVDCGFTFIVFGEI
ncbi:MAG: hypothetical protein F6K31_21325 [Symploca sp. SIO2G7]|nr:hypothetical protein [Symploca sp. SIO2G7]